MFYVFDMEQNKKMQQNKIIKSNNINQKNTIRNNQVFECQLQTQNYDLNMIALPIIGFLITGTVNYFTAKFGYFNNATSDKDILFPFSSTIFLFFSLLIYLPETHGKITILQQQSPNINKQLQAEQQQQNFPIAFLVTLISLTVAVFFDKFFLNKSEPLKDADEQVLKDGHNNHGNYPQDQKSKYQAQTLKYFLTTSVLFNNLFSAYFITVQHKQSSIWAELLIFLIFGLILNFSYGYLLAWIQVEESIFDKLVIFMNSGLLAGLVLGLLLKIQFPLVFLPCISIGLAIYSAVFVCFPKIFTNGQKATQDKFRYWAIFTALLITLIYYPIIYLLKI